MYSAFIGFPDCCKFAPLARKSHVRVQRIQRTLWRALPASLNLYRVSAGSAELSGFLFHLPQVLS
jgi:hypothetical protein